MLLELELVLVLELRQKRVWLLLVPELPLMPQKGMLLELLQVLELREKRVWVLVLERQKQVHQKRVHQKRVLVLEL